MEDESISDVDRFKVNMYRIIYDDDGDVIVGYNVYGKYIDEIRYFVIYINITNVDDVVHSLTECLNILNDYSSSKINVVAYNVFYKCEIKTETYDLFGNMTQEELDDLHVWTDRDCINLPLIVWYAVCGMIAC